MVVLQILSESESQRRDDRGRSERGFEEIDDGEVIVLSKFIKRGVSMDSFIKELMEREFQSIIEVMAFMSYNPSIGRVLEKGGVKKFQKMAMDNVSSLSKIKTIRDYDQFHYEWISNFIKNIKTNNEAECSYGQAQKAINVFMKLYSDWARLPDQNTSKKIIPFLHVPLDRIIMKTISNHYPVTSSQQRFSLSKVNEEIYKTWQNFFREKYPKKPLLFDIAWAIYR